MEIDTEQHQMRYSVNGIDHGIAFDDIDFDETNYNMAVFAGDETIVVKLTDFRKCMP